MILTKGNLMTSNKELSYFTEHKGYIHEPTDLDKIETAIEKERLYRRAFCAGFTSARSSETTFEKVRKWLHDNETKMIGAPGTYMEGELLEDLDPSKLYEKRQKQIEEYFRNEREKKC